MFAVTEKVLVRARIAGAFYGFDSDAVFELESGSCWQQARYRYWYHYAYRPVAEVFDDGRGLQLRLQGRSESAFVHRIEPVIHAHIKGAFNGWQGNSIYELDNGQIWQQQTYAYQYAYAYRPAVRIYPVGATTVMDVDGYKADVKRIR